MLKQITLFLLLQVALMGSDIGIFEVSFHGKFCGNNTPSVAAKTREEEIKLLKEIPAIDVIDEACKKHDICYLTRGDKDLTCDNDLVGEITKIQNKLKKKNCRVLAKAIIIYFDTVNYNPITILDSGDSIRDKAIDIPTISMDNMFNMASFSSDVMVNFGMTKPIGYVFDSKNNSDRKKEVLQLFPPKYKKCELE